MASMSADLQQKTAVRFVPGKLNFARSRDNGGVWSNTDAGSVKQDFRSETVRVADAATAIPPTSLDREGFARFRHQIPQARWYDDEWLAAVYLPLCCDLVRDLIGADLVAPLHRGVLRRKAQRSPSEGGPAPAAGFVHLDQSPSVVEDYAAQIAGADFRDRFGSYRMLNLWRAISAPPHNMPLALCDQRTVDRGDLVVGHTVEPKLTKGAFEYLTSLYNPAQRWWFNSDLTADDLLLFNGFDPDETQPIGCLHSAFVDRTVAASAPPRESIECRVFAFFK